MSSVLWSFMNCLAVVFVKEDFLSMFLKRKKNCWIFICVWMFYFLFHFMTKVENYIINLIQDATVTVIVCWLGYETALRIKILISVLSVAIGALSEEIIVVLLINIKGSIDGNIMLYSLMGKIIFWLCTRVLSMIYKGKMEAIEQQRRYGNLLLLTAGSILISNYIIFLISNSVQDSTVQMWLLISVFIILLLDIIVFKVYAMHKMQLDVERENREYAYQVQYYDKQIKDRQAMIQEVRRTRHDMKNNMIYLKELLNTDAEKARKFLDEYIGQSEATDEISKSGNLAVDALINYKNMTAREKGITIHLESQIPAELPYESTDLSIILGNLLDNAIEATEKLEVEKDIFVSLMYRKEKLLIKVRNPYTGDLKKDRVGNYISEKKDRENHGIGLKSVRKVVEKYEGVMEIHTEDQIFEICVII